MADNDKFLYEDAIEELSRIVDKLSTGKCSLDDSLDLYTRGVKLASLCDKKLSEVEKKIAVINKDSLEEEPFAEDQ
ncbi:MAG: exodeoxyribonuclease VII small subunit [Saccharofermentans sp.]|nr:exodeoxyribonuclease VII small subunit [Saccharofermentans sp.]